MLSERSVEAPFWFSACTSTDVLLDASPYRTRAAFCLGLRITWSPGRTLPSRRSPATTVPPSYNRITPVKRRSFHRPRWTDVTRKRRQANSLKVMQRSWQQRRATQSSSTRSAGHLRCDRVGGVALSLDGSSSAPGADRHAPWRGCSRPSR